MLKISSLPMALVMILSLVGLCSVNAGQALLESHASLAHPPDGAIEVKTGTFNSVMLNKSVPFRAFAPASPKWKDIPPLNDATEVDQPKAMPLVVYVINLASSPRPSSATDREIIEDLLARQYLVVVVDYKGAKRKDHLEFQKDIAGLFHVFGGSKHATYKWYTENRRELTRIPGPHKGKEITSFSLNTNGRLIDLPINDPLIYVIPSGYTVQTHLVFKKDFPGHESRPDLFFDIVYPMPAKKTTKLPLMLETSSNGSGPYLVNANTPILYSWLFNGYAFATMSHVPVRDNNLTSYPIIHALRYLNWKSDTFSLNGKMGTAGISKSSPRTFSESNFLPRATEVDKEPYGKESNRVLVTMPASGHLDNAKWEFYPSWEHLHEDSPAVVLSWHQIDTMLPLEQSTYQQVTDSYNANGMREKVWYKTLPQAGHEYNLYDLNEIMAFWDRFCK